MRKKNVMRFRPALILWSLVMALVLVVAACGGDDDEDKATAPPTAPATATRPAAVATTAPVAPTATPAPAIKRGGIFKTQDVGIPHLDPTIVDVSGQANFLDVIYDGLLTMAGKSYNDFDVTGQLAESWQVSADSTEYTFRLRDGVKWQNVAPVNGRAFTSADVAFIIDWSLANKPGKTYGTYKTIVSHREPDARTIVIKTATPQASFLPRMAGPEVKILPRELLEEKEGTVTKSQNLAIGTGPFQFDGLERGVSAKAKANPSYYKRGADGQPLPYLVGWESYTIRDYAARLASLKTRQVDRWYWPGGINGPDAKDIQRNNPEWKVEQDLFVVSPNIAADVRLAPFNDIRARRALALAINRKQIIDVRFQGDAVLSGFVNPARKEWSWDQETIAKKFPYDPEQAKSLLAQSGYKGEEITFLHYTGASAGFDPQTAEIVAEMMRQVGFKVKLEVVPDYAAMSARMNAGRAPVNLNANYGHTIEDQLYQWYHTTSPTNWVGVKDTALDALLDKEQSTVDPAARSKVVLQILDHLYDNMYGSAGVTPLAFRADARWVKGLQQNRVAGNYHRELVWIDPSLRP